MPLPTTVKPRRTKTGSKPTFKELHARVNAALQARDTTALTRCFRALSSMSRDGRVGRRRACSVCRKPAQSIVGGEVLHASDCALEADLNRIEAFIGEGIDHLRAKLGGKL